MLFSSLLFQVSAADEEPADEDIVSPVGSTGDGGMHVLQRYIALQ